MADDKKSEEQVAAEEFAATQPKPRSMAVPGNDLSGYLGTAPEYQNYAGVGQKPFLTDDERWRFTPLTDEEVDAANKLREETASDELGNKDEPSAMVESDLSQAAQSVKDASAVEDNPTQPVDEPAEQGEKKSTATKRTAPSSSTSDK